MNKIHPFFKKAIKASKNSDHKQHKVGAAIYYKNKFIATGYNSLKTHPITHYYAHAFTLHAEIHALLKAKAKRFDLNNASIFVYREQKSGETGLARPCQMCMDKIIMEGIKEIIYTDYHNKYERIKCI